MIVWKMDKYRALLFLIGFLTFAESHLKINKLNVPNSLEIGSKEDLILDCVYEAEDEEGLEIKWFYDDQQIYQWIPWKSGPRALGRLSDRIDLEYMVTDDESNMYRALRIKNVTLDLSGNYTCKVSSFYNEQVKTKKLIIYEPVDELILSNNESAETVICEASGVYPKPQIKLYISGSNGTLHEKINNTNLEDNNISFGDDEEDDDKEYLETEDGFFNVTDSLVYEVYDLPYPTKFICELTIPDTDYKAVKSIVYYPGGAPTTPETEYEFDIPTNSTEKIIEDNFGNSLLPSWRLVTALLSSLLFIYVII